MASTDRVIKVKLTADVSEVLAALEQVRVAVEELNRCGIHVTSTRLDEWPRTHHRADTGTTRTVER